MTLDKNVLDKKDLDKNDLDKMRSIKWRDSGFQSTHPVCLPNVFTIVICDAQAFVRRTLLTELEKHKFTCIKYRKH